MSRQRSTLGVLLCAALCGAGCKTAGQQSSQEPVSTVAAAQAPAQPSPAARVDLTNFIDFVRRNPVQPHADCKHEDRWDMSLEGLDKVGNLFDERLDNTTYVTIVPEQEGGSEPQRLYLTSDPIQSSDIYMCGKCRQTFLVHTVDGIGPRRTVVFFRYDENTRYEIDPAAIFVSVQDKDLSRVLELFGADASGCKNPDAYRSAEYQSVFKVARDTRYPAILNCRRMGDGTIGFDVIGPRELLKRYRMADWK